VAFAYVSGNPALDLAGTLEHRRGQRIDLLRSPVDLERWVAGCGELPDRVRADAEALERAVTLREAIYRLALDRLHGRPFDPASRAILNEAAAGPVPVPALTDRGLRLSGDITAALGHVARCGVTVLADPRARLKECGLTDCTRLYLDRSRGARRTWCGMAGCGDRVKAAAYRARQRRRHAGGS